MGIWHYEEAPLNGGAPGDAYKSVFNGSGMKQAAVLAREAIQNSVDAAQDPDEPVRVDFRFRRLEGAERRDFETAAGLDEMLAREPDLGLPASNILRRTDGPLDLLYIDDYGTTGLHGDPTDPSSNLRKLLMDLGGSEKAQDGGGTGGSYGFGKAVYSSNSRIGTIFAFSRTENADGAPLSLLMGCAYQSGHTREGIRYTGRAWLGLGLVVPGHGVRYDPLLGEEAEHAAEALGFERDGDDPGTSLLLIDAGVEPEDVVAGIEDWWWPRIEARLLDADVFTAWGEVYRPRPKKRAHLKPFIDAYDSAVGKVDIPGKQARKVFNRLSGLNIGDFGAVVLDDSEVENPLGEGYEERLDTVALVRGPLMVVQYHRKWRASSTAPPVVGCFRAHSDIDHILKLAEPPAHDRWDPEAQRLAAYDEEAPKIVESVLSRIRKSFRDFQNAAKPPAPPKPRRLAKLERNLASWFGVGPKNGPVNPDPNPAPISLRPYGPHIRLDGDHLRASGHVEIGFAGDPAAPDMPFRVRLTLKVAEEDGVSGSDPIPLSLTPQSPLKPIGDDFWVGVVTPDRPACIDFESAPYDPSWTVQLVPEVLPVEESTS